MTLDKEMKEMFCIKGASFISYYKFFGEEECERTCNYAMKKDLDNLKEEMFGRLSKKMKVKERDWDKITKHFWEYRKSGYTTEDSFNSALLVCGPLRLKA